jgi:hypothetical protein
MCPRGHVAGWLYVSYWTRMGELMELCFRRPENPSQRGSSRALYSAPASVHPDRGNTNRAGQTFPPTGMFTP